MKRLKGYREVRRVSAGAVKFWREMLTKHPDYDYAKGWLAGYEYGRTTPDEKIDREPGYVRQVEAER